MGTAAFDVDCHVAAALCRLLAAALSRLPCCCGGFVPTALLRRRCADCDVDVLDLQDPRLADVFIASSEVVSEKIYLLAVACGGCVLSKAVVEGRQGSNCSTRKLLSTDFENFTLVFIAPLHFKRSIRLS